MRAILLRPAGENALVLNAQPHPPDIELGEPTECRSSRTGRRCPCESPAAARRSRKSRSKTARTPEPFGRPQAVTRDQEPRVLIGDRERIAVDAVLGAEVAFEVGRPEIIRVGGRERAPRPDEPTGGAAAASSPTPGAPTDRRPCWSPAARRPGVAARATAGASRGPSADAGAGPRKSSRRRPPGCGADSDAAHDFGRRGRPAPPASNALEPFVAGLPTDGVAVAELGHRVEPALLIADEAFALFHGCCLQPGHRPTSVGPQRKGVTHVPGLLCYPCSRSVPTAKLIADS